ncbi:hypothetical protein ASPZODRAFT_62154 [Penicilliopsis zonata CBS 506.65]|uniref:Myb-like domain-containing protein n=1 Tax=Penicilliopsis zonata CBS 506.65 TaxID=1073090 RepID=A0A1L9SMK7_9EURO|nr:hypothetical protein ASPZODRAFT_62154 [Penicilliopsis zonata CBS 506.65]OJJ48267.1 hypothetical protein ASPZODRAFT_62154 [Penicilliopsis zonata CBS 506.65]
MLLPSALPCDLLRPSRFAASRLLSTPPPEDPYYPPGNGLLGTCRALQSLLSGSPAPPSRREKPARLQSPLQLRTPPRSTRSRVRATPKPEPPRGANKRRREEEEGDSADRFSTPKRSRHAPYDLPLGLAPSDFYSLHSPPSSEPRSPIDPDAAIPSIEVTDTESSSRRDNHNDWTADDDERLVAAVLAKFNLSQSDWAECARRLGRDDASIGRRWASLVGDGDVGLRRGGRRLRPAIDMWR